MIRPQVTVDGRAVRIPLAFHTDPLLDDLAVAYAEDPDTVGRLLARHAASVLAHDHAVCSEDASDLDRAMRAAEADGSREALLEELPEQPDPQYSPDDAITLAGRITRAASHVRHRTSPEGTHHP
ncbi:hypothetical protein [Streptomyces shenzhenensis]|uniref:Uncharacterized protein n=1 Tax=Streptomyces shenzhenensis TaxID=943815 RepID=A0A3M0I5T5_9ACTN|nr:hypothetical protein [Streptomyces shenzhenensis]RMB83678.1 hypothetical protein CTZ28_23465 [Streptomyces shenzhenensis]